MIAAELEEWEIRREIFENSLLKYDSSVDAELGRLKINAMKWLESSKFRHCAMDLKICFYDKIDYKNMINDVKTWLLAQQMIKRQVPVEFIRPNWKHLIHHLKVPKEILMITPIKPNMNLYFLMNNAGADFETSIEILNEIMDAISFVSYATEASKIRMLRHKMMQIVLTKPVTLESINLRLKAFERFAESAVRSNQMKLPIYEQFSTVCVKIWLLSRQIFVEDGWNENVFGFVSPIENGTSPVASKTDYRYNKEVEFF